jgi:hypothetical protein
MARIINDCHRPMAWFLPGIQDGASQSEKEKVRWIYGLSTIKEPGEVQLGALSRTMP